LLNLDALENENAGNFFKIFYFVGLYFTELGVPIPWNV